MNTFTRVSGNPRGLQLHKREQIRAAETPLALTSYSEARKSARICPTSERRLAYVEEGSSLGDVEEFVAVHLRLLRELPDTGVLRRTIVYRR